VNDYPSLILMVNTINFFSDSSPSSMISGFEFERNQMMAISVYRIQNAAFAIGAAAAAGRPAVLEGSG